MSLIAFFADAAVMAKNRRIAGAYAQERYNVGLDAYRSRLRLPAIVLLGPFIMGGIVGLLLLGHGAAWAAGLASGLGIGALLVLRDSPPAYLENWSIGAEGERKTERVLRGLDSSRWLVVHEVDAGRGNYDHIVVGSAGVFLLETKNLQGSVHIENGRPYLRRRLDPEANRSCQWLVSQAVERACALHDELRRRTGRRIWVQAVVVLWSDFEQGVADVGMCALVHGPHIVEWLAAQEDAFDENAAEQLSRAVEAMAR